MTSSSRPFTPGAVASDTVTASHHILTHEQVIAESAPSLDDAVFAAFLADAGALWQFAYQVHTDADSLSAITDGKGAIASLVHRVECSIGGLLEHAPTKVLLSSLAEDERFVACCRKVGKDVLIRLEWLQDVTASGSSSVAVGSKFRDDFLAAWSLIDVEALGARLNELIAGHEDLFQKKYVAPVSHHHVGLD